MTAPADIDQIVRDILAHMPLKEKAIIANLDPVQEMINISSKPVLIPRMPYGKHKGMLFKDVPVDYLQWLSGTELDEDMAYTVKYHLGLVPNQ